MQSVHDLIMVSSEVGQRLVKMAKDHPTVPPSTVPLTPSGLPIPALPVPQGKGINGEQST